MLQHENVWTTPAWIPQSLSNKIPTDRTKRLKEARSEAQKEIDEYRKQKEDEFKAFEKEVRALER